MSLVEYQRAFSRVCFAAEPSEADLSLLGGEAARWRLYRDMVRARMRNMAKTAFARTVLAVGEPAFDESYDRYLGLHRPRSALIREVTVEVGEFALTDPELDLPLFARELLRFELAKWELAYQPVGCLPPTREFDFEGPPVLNPVFRVLRLAYPVQRDDADPTQPAPTALFVYRPPNVQAVRWWSPDDFGAAVFEALLGGESCVADAVRAAATRAGETLDGALLERLSSLLALAVERGVLLGTREAS